MASGDRRPSPMVIPRRNVPELRPDGDALRDSSGHRPLSGLPEHPGAVVPDGLGAAQPSRHPAPRATLHIALIVPDIKLYGQLRRSAYLLTPPGWDGDAKLHVLIKDPKTEPTDMLYRYALTELGLVDAAVAGLTYPDTIELGWTDEPR